MTHLTGRDHASPTCQGCTRGIRCPPALWAVDQSQAHTANTQLHFSSTSPSCPGSAGTQGGPMKPSATSLPAGRTARHSYCGKAGVRLCCGTQHAGGCRNCAHGGAVPPWSARPAGSCSGTSGVRKRTRRTQGRHGGSKGARADHRKGACQQPVRTGEASHRTSCDARMLHAQRAEQSSVVPPPS